MWTAYVLKVTPPSAPSNAIDHSTTSQTITTSYFHSTRASTPRMTVIVGSPSPIPPPFADLAALHALPISERPRRTWAQFWNALAFGVVFNLGCVLINVSQFVLLLPLRVLHFFAFGRRLYDAGIRRSKGAFGTLLGEVLYSNATLSSPPGSPILEAPRGSLGLFPDAMSLTSYLYRVYSDDVLVVCTHEPCDHVRNQRAGAIYPRRV